MDYFTTGLQQKNLFSSSYAALGRRKELKSRDKVGYKEKNSFWKLSFKISKTVFNNYN